MDLGTLVAELGRFGEAVPHYGRALALHPSFAAAHVNLAVALRELGRPEDALAHHGRALEHDPALAAAHHNLGLIFGQRGMIAEAVVEQERARALKPDFAPAKLALCMVELPVLDQQRFVAAAGLCDIVLDSIGWSGGATSLESLTHDLPIVTLPGSLMRGRHTMAMLELIGVADTIAATTCDYVSLAARLAQDLTWRKEVNHRIAQGKHRLYRDRSCIAALEDFLLGVTGAETRNARFDS